MKHGFLKTRKWLPFSKVQLLRTGGWISVSWTVVYIYLFLITSRLSLELILFTLSRIQWNLIKFSVDIGIFNAVEGFLGIGSSQWKDELKFQKEFDYLR